MTLQFTLVSPEKILFDQEVSMVVVPGVEGDLGILPGHAPLLTLLRPGVVSVYEKGHIFVKLFIDGGFCEITSEKCTALVTSGMPLASLNKSALEMEIKSLLEEREDSKTLDAQKKADQNLQIARAKLLEITALKKSG